MSEKQCPTCDTWFAPKRGPFGQPARYCSGKCRPSKARRARVAEYAPQSALGTNPATCDRVYTDDEVALLKAVEAFKKRSGVRFLDCCQILALIVLLGYKRCDGGGESGT